VGRHSSASASRLLGLDGFEVVSAEPMGGEWQLTTQTTAAVVGCVGCGVRAELHGRRTVRVRDLPAGGRPVVLCWRKRIWRCREPACGVRTWTERVTAIRARAVLTERARAEACRRVGKDAHAVAAVARDLGVGWATVMRAVHEHGARWWTIPAACRGGGPGPGRDELPEGHPGGADPVGHRSGRPGARSAAGAGGRPHQGRGGRLANTVVDQVRRRVQQATLGHRGRKPDPLYRIRKLLLTATEQLTQRRRARLRAGLAAGDSTGEVAAAWQGKELLRAVYAAVGPAAARAALDRFYGWTDGVGVAELSRLARTVRAWEAEILAFHSTNGCSNGPTEAVNLLIKKVKRVGHGFRNFANYRLRLLLHCGVRWQTHRTASLRGRSPHVVG
jgi:transposase